MEFSRYLLAGLLLMISSQAHALFMPDGFKINSEDTESDGGCGALVIRSESAF